MSEILVKYDEPIAAPNGMIYFAQAVGSEMKGGQWEGWIEFFPVSEVGSAVESGRETTQPNRANLELWAQGLTAVYLEGALDRAISVAAGPHESVMTAAESGTFTKPARRSFTPSSPPTGAERRPILNPFDVYAQGEQVLRGQLNALSRDHLESVASAFGAIASPRPSEIERVPTADLIEAIVMRARDNPFRGGPDSAEQRARS
jgi:hypothetical protein